jgi:hypothetical protein
VRKSITLPLYYTGLTNAARIREHDGKPRRYVLDSAYRVEVLVREVSRLLRYLTGPAGHLVENCNVPNAYSGLLRHMEDLLGFGSALSSIVN